MAEVHEAAKQRILAAFPPSADPASEFHKYPERFYTDILGTLSHRIPFRKAMENESLSRFLYAGCLSFDRWFAPSPFVVHPDQRAHFASFVTALRAIGAAPDNTATFRLHQLRDALYHEFEGLPVESVSNERIAFYRTRINAIPAPTHPTKVAEYERERSSVESVLAGLHDRSLRTDLTTRLPYVLHPTPLSLSFLKGGVPGTMEVEPTFNETGECSFVAEPAIMAVGASRWQGGTSGIKMSLAALHDADAFSEALQALEGQDLPFTGWPQCFTLAFAIIHDVAWRLRMESDSDPPWVPAPRDLGEMEIALTTAQAGQISWKLKGSPAQLIHVFTPRPEVAVRDLGELDAPPWSVRCRSLAIMYTQLGDTNEALFWLNVATEALLKERFGQIAGDLGRPELETELNSPKAFWAPAEECVSAQFPEMAGRVVWPDTEVHVSVYAKLKYLYRVAPMSGTVKDVLVRYRAIAEHRNALFHGVSEGRVPVAVVQAAMVNFDWLIRNVTLQRQAAVQLEPI